MFCPRKTRSVSEDIAEIKKISIAIDDRRGNLDLCAWLIHQEINEPTSIEQVSICRMCLFSGHPLNKWVLATVSSRVCWINFLDMEERYDFSHGSALHWFATSVPNLEDKTIFWWDLIQWRQYMLVLDQLNSMYMHLYHYSSLSHRPCRHPYGIVDLPATDKGIDQSLPLPHGLDLRNLPIPKIYTHITKLIVNYQFQPLTQASNELFGPQTEIYGTDKDPQRMVNYQFN